MEGKAMSKNLSAGPKLDCIYTTNFERLISKRTPKLNCCQTLAMFFLLAMLSFTSSIEAQSVELGSRVMLTQASQIKRFNLNPLTADVPGAICKVTSIESDELIVKDMRGMARTKRKSVIVLRSPDTINQIKSRIAKEHQEFALAQFASLHDLDESFTLLENLLTSNPNHEWARIRLADILLAVKRNSDVKHVLTGMSTKSDAWPVATVALAATNPNRKTAIQGVLGENRRNVYAYTVLIRELLVGAFQKMKNGKPLDSKSELQSAFELIEQMECELPERLESARLRLLLHEIVRLAGVSLPEGYFDESLKRAYLALKQDPFDHELMADMANTLALNGQFEDAAKISLKLIRAFPRSIRSATSIHRIAVEIPELLNSSPYSATTRMDIIVRDWENVSIGIKKTFNADIPFSKDPSLSLPTRLVDGDGRLSNGAANDRKSQLSPLAILCADNNSACLRFFNEATYGIDFDRIEVSEIEALVEICLKFDSADALQFLVEMEQLKRLQKSAIRRVLASAIREKAFGCLYLFCKSGFSLDEDSIAGVSSMLGCNVAEIYSELKHRAWQRAIKLAVADISRYELRVAEKLSLVELNKERMNQLDARKKTQYYGDPGSTVFIPNIHVYSGTTAPERGVRFRQAMQADISANTYRPSEDELQQIEQLKADVLDANSNLSHQLNFFFMETNAKLLRHFGRQVRLVGDGAIENWQTEIRQKLKGRKSSLYELFVAMQK